MQNTKPHISVVAPLYRCSECISELCMRLISNLEKINPNFEIILINDASPDNDWEILLKEASTDSRIKGINLTRNFGQHHAITAGLDVAEGEWVVVMDADLQDQPEEIENLYAKAQEGYDVVFGVMGMRQDGFFKKFMSLLFRLVYTSLSEVKPRPATSNFSIISREVIKNFRRIRDESRAYALIILWMGYKTGYVTVKHSKRFAGQTTYSLRKSMGFAIDSIVSQSSRPLRLSIEIGFIVSALSLLLGLWLIFRHFFLGIAVPGWASIMVSLYFIGGMIFANMGVIGIYLGKIFDETKGRPLYIVRETINFPASTEEVRK
ncbi:glycosyltransferase family 2 protein [Thermodesulfobacteriota bacterium]